MWMPLNMNSCNLIHFAEGMKLLRVSENDCQLKLLILVKGLPTKAPDLKKGLPTRAYYLGKKIANQSSIS